MHAELWVPRAANLWESSTTYTVGITVLKSGYTYKCLEINTNNTPDSSTRYWKKLYEEGENVYYDGTLYSCSVAHEPNTSFKEDFLLGNWKKLSWDLPKPWVFRHLYSENEVVAYGHLRFICLCRHESSPAFKQDYYTEKAQSYSSNDLSTGTKTFSIAGNTYKVNQRVRCASQEKSRSYIDGFILISTLDSITVSIDSISGNEGDTFNAWDISILIWEAIPLRKKQAPPWLQDSQFLEEYLSATDSVMTDLVDMPTIELGNLRSIDVGTHLDIISKTSVLLGFDLSKFSWLLTGNFLNYVVYLARYKAFSGTEQFMQLLNFLMKQQDATNNWTLSQLYTHDYKVFKRPEALPVNPITDIYTTELYENNPGSDYVCIADCIPTRLVSGVNLHYSTLLVSDNRIGRINPNIYPTDKPSSWVLRSPSSAWDTASVNSHKGNWSPFSAYKAGDIVHVDNRKYFATSRYELTSGKFYRCLAISEGQHPADSTIQWTPIVGITDITKYKGYWYKAKVYQIGDIVHLPLSKDIINMFYMLAPATMVLNRSYPDYSSVLFGFPKLIEITTSCSEIEESIDLEYLSKNVTDLGSFDRKRVLFN